MVMMPQDTRRFTPRLDFLTTPGYLTGGRSRENSGLPQGTGPHRVITNMAVMGFDDTSRRMTVLSVNPGYSRDTVQSHCGFELLWADTVDQTEPPGAEELKLLRDVIDPGGYVIGRAG
jgi:glutaconate CoA-transferase subunit B